MTSPTQPLFPLCPECATAVMESTGPMGEFRVCPECGYDTSPGDEPAWFVSDANNIQRDDDGDLSCDVEAVRDALTLWLAGDERDQSDVQRHGATSRADLLACCAATLVRSACASGHAPTIHDRTHDLIERANSGDLDHI